MDYNTLKVADLKGLLKERGIPSTGLSRKQQIIEALERHNASAEENGDTEVVKEGEESEEVADDAASAAGDAADESAGKGTADGAVAEFSKVEEQDMQDSETATVPAETTQAQTEDRSLPEPETETSEPPAPETTSSAQPIVLEANRPVSKEPSALTTPRQTSPVADSTSSDRKRKRRSPTPPVDEESVKKKLKAADEDFAPLPEVATREESAMQTIPDEQTSDPAREDMDIDSIDASKSAMAQTDGAADTSDAIERPIHPSTRAIYISNLVRPIQPVQLRDYLTSQANGADSLELFHLGSIRTHAFAVYKTAPSAMQVRSRLHGQVWPDEPARKALWVDFVPEEKVQEWIDRETEGTGRRDNRRWEVLYDETDDGIVARHEEATGVPGAPDRKPSNAATPGQGMGMPNAPLGPRSSRPSVPNVPPTEPAKQATPNPTSSASFFVLDEKFPSTTAKPNLYFLPVDKDLAERRIEELERQTSREWGARGGEMAGGDVRRYTFEDGDRIVDGGPHYDDFSGPRGGAGGGRRRGGGGFRGRR